MERLDFVIGATNWQDRYPYSGCCEIGLCLAVREQFQWVWKSDGADQTNVEGVKGQFSDAFKRAAVKWGVGRYLYDLPNTWIDLVNGKKFKTEPKLPTWATPNGWKRIQSSVKKEFYSQMIEVLSKDDKAGVIELLDEFDQDEQVQLWSLFDSKQRAAIKSLKAS